MKLRLCVAFAIFVFKPLLAHACGPCGGGSISHRGDVPDTLELNDSATFLNGDLGVIRPYLLPTYLYVVYRYLDNLPLSDAEKSEIAPLMNGLGDCSVAEKPKPTCSDGFAAWQQILRDFGEATIPANPPPPLLNTETYTYSQNIHDDAWREAAATYWKRKESWGKGSAELGEWISGQKAVFDLVEPTILEASAAPLLLADRSYQIASFCLYSGDYARASKLFTEISEQKDSPWQSWGLYLAARAKIRAEELSEAKEILQSVLNNPDLAMRHRMAQQLLTYLDFRAHFKESVTNTFQSLARPTSNRPLGDAMRDFAFLCRQDGLANLRNNNDPEKWPTLDERTPAFVRWVTVASRSSGAFIPNSNNISYGKAESELYREGILNEWKRAKSHLPWLVMALIATKTHAPDTAELLERAAEIPYSSPAGPTIRFHQIRLLIGLGRKSEATRFLEEVLRDPRVNSSVARTQPFREFEALLTDKAHVFTKNLNLDSLNFYDGCGGLAQAPAVFDPEMNTSGTMPLTLLRAVNSGLPIERLIALSENESLPKELRTKLAIAAWTRAVVIGDEKRAVLAGKKLAVTYPAFEPMVLRYERSEPGAARLRSVLLEMARNPKFSTVVSGLDGSEDFSATEERSSYNVNWWCSTDLVDPSNREQILWGYLDTIWPSPEGDFIPQFLTEKERSDLSGELKSLREKGSAPEFFWNTVQAWRKDQPAADELPELLHHIVGIARWSPCSSTVAKNAFQLLHKAYPKSSWAKMTKIYHQ